MSSSTIQARRTTVKYQVFVSSTYEDLRNERDQVIKAVLEMGHIPVGMEMFSAADEEQWKLITRQIDESDYYVVIAAHRCGSMIDEVSYTEREYDYAVRASVPIIGFIIDDDAPWPAHHVERDPEKLATLASFKEKMRRKPIGVWASADDLYGKFSIAFGKLMATNPRPGWVRATEIAGPEVATELSRLSSENSRLRTELEAVQAQQAEDTSAQHAKTVSALRTNKIKVQTFDSAKQAWSDGDDITLYRFFLLIAPEMQVEISSEESATYAILAAGKAPDDYRAKWPVPRNSVKSWLSDLMTLGLIEPSKRRRSLRDSREYWTLTEYGRGLYQTIRRARLEAGLSAPPSTASLAEKASPTEDGHKTNKKELK